MKKTSVLFILLCLIATWIAIPVFGTTENLDNASPNTCHTLDASSALLGSGKLIENAKSAIVFESNSKTLMYALNPDEQMHPASLVKILTALIASEEGNMDDIVTVSESAISSMPNDAVSAKLVTGEQIRLEDLLYCLLVGSANDAAVVIAEHISGNQNAFIQRMNEYAKSLNCTGTQFTNPHGLHNADQYTTARDVARILDAAMQNEIFRSIFTTTSHTVPATNLSEERNLGTNNSMMDTASKLYYDARVIGGRTGVAGDGRRCIATAAESNGMLLITVVMGSETEYQEDGYSAIRVGGYHETTALLNAGFNGYKSAQILSADQALVQCDVLNGDSDVILGSQVSVSAVLPETVSAGDLSFRYADNQLQAPIEKGQAVSSVQVWHQNMCVAEAELIAMNSVKLDDHVQPFVDEEGDKDGQTFLWILLVVCGVAAAVYAITIATRKFKSALVKNRSKQYRRSRRRSR